jgi:hypothetical protein
VNPAPITAALIIIITNSLFEIGALFFFDKRQMYLLQNAFNVSSVDNSSCKHATNNVGETDEIEHDMTEPTNLNL